jgi:hypothetical protein
MTNSQTLYTDKEKAFILKCYNKGMSIMQTLIEHNKIKTFPKRRYDGIRHQLWDNGYTCNRDRYKKSDKIMFLHKKGLSLKDIEMILPEVSDVHIRKTVYKYTEGKRRTEWKRK